MNESLEFRHDVPASDVENLAQALGLSLCEIEQWMGNFSAFRHCAHCGVILERGTYIGNRCGACLSKMRQRQQP